MKQSSLLNFIVPKKTPLPQCETASSAAVEEASEGRANGGGSCAGAGGGATAPCFLEVGDAATVRERLALAAEARERENQRQREAQTAAEQTA